MDKLENKTILILDDTKPIRLLLLKRLEKKYNCILSHNPVNAIKLIREYRDSISLIITDYQMPKLNGYEFLKKIQFIPNKIPVILLSSSLTELRLKELYQMGVRIFMVKPVKLNRLVKEIEFILKETEQENSEEKENGAVNT